MEPSDGNANFTKGDRVVFTPEEGEERPGTVIGKAPVRGVIGVTLDGDPFGVCLSTRQLRKEHDGDMEPVAELRKEAVRLGIEGWEELTIAELKAAVVEARGGEPMATKAKSRSRSKAKTTRSRSRAKPKAKAPARKAKANSNGSNPYRPGSSMATAFDLLVQGGTVKSIAAKLAKKHPINLRAKSEIEDPDKYVTYHTQGRTLMVLKQASESGFKTVKDGKGPEAFVQIKP